MSVSNAAARSSRTPFLLALLAVVLLGCAAWANGRMRRGRAEALEARGDLADCEAFVEAIRSHRGAEPAAAIDDLDGRFQAHIEAARKAAGMGESVRIVTSTQARASRRLGESPFVEHPLKIDVRGVPLAQVLTFCYGLAAGDPPLTPREMRLAPSDARGTEDRWDLELTVTHLQYEPNARER